MAMMRATALIIMIIALIDNANIINNNYNNKCNNTVDDNSDSSL